jgi:hypothetical protein
MHDIRTNDLSRVFRQILNENLDRCSMMYCEWYWLKIWIDDYYEWYCKPGGLDVSRRRFSNCLDFLNSQDVGFWTVEIESLNRDYVKNQDFKARRFLNCRDFFDSWDVVFELLRLSQQSRCWFSNCRDRESQSRLCQKSRF